GKRKANERGGLRERNKRQGRSAEGKFETVGEKENAMVCVIQPLKTVYKQEICKQQRTEVKTFTAARPEPKIEKSQVQFI
ncbi:hypothetical protein AMQ83_22155, partial [Paenibacillus riograndensis]